MDASKNKLQLGLFAANLDGGFTATTAPEKHSIMDWDTMRRVAQKADRAGFEIQVPLARWASLGGETDFCGINLEPLTWAAGLAEATSHSKILATIHVPLLHPVYAAKQMATIDRISGGRFGLNIVVGWNPQEFAMFGESPFEHDEGYVYAQEWIDIVKRLWSEDEPFDYKGKYFDLKGLWMQPKPISKPWPLLMNAGSSPAGSAYAVRNTDVALRATAIGEDATEIWRSYREQATALGREIDIWAGLWVICRDTDEEAQEYYRYVIEEKGDIAAFAGMNPGIMPSTEGLSEEEAFKLKARTLAAWGTKQAVGSPDTVVKALTDLHDQGADGVVIVWPNYEEGIEGFEEHVLPRLEKAGLRKPFNP